MKRVLISVLSIFIVTYAFAQQQKANERFGATVEDLFTGDYTYQFIKQENGKDVKVGPFEMKATINEKYNNYKTFWELKVTGKYNLKGNSRSARGEHLNLALVPVHNSLSYGKANAVAACLGVSGA